jgi:hypothetical protein
MKTAIAIASLLSIACLDLSATQCKEIRICNQKYHSCRGVMIDKGLVVLTDDGAFFICNHSICHAKKTNCLNANATCYYVYNFSYLSEEGMKKLFPNSWEEVNKLWINYIATL